MLDDVRTELQDAFKEGQRSQGQLNEALSEIKEIEQIIVSLTPLHEKVTQKRSFPPSSWDWTLVDLRIKPSLGKIEKALKGQINQLS